MGRRSPAACRGPVEDRGRDRAAHGIRAAGREVQPVVVGREAGLQDRHQVELLDAEIVRDARLGLVDGAHERVHHSSGVVGVERLLVGATATTSEKSMS